MDILDKPGLLSWKISLSKSDGNKSTSLMARDLLTPDEIKQLHYKMIIFPITGYPIFRDTILYKKFISYKSGKIERINHPLKDLAYTYFTVEKISKNKSKSADDNIIDSSDFMKELKNSCIERFKEIKDDLILILNNEKYSINYIENNFQYYLQDKMSKKLSKHQKQSIEKKYSNFHIEYNEDNNHQIINVYFMN